MAQIFRPPSGKKRKSNRRSHQTGSRLKGVDVQALDHSGVGVAREHQPVIFVDGALPGERVDVEVTDRKKRVWRGHVSNVDVANEHRTEPFCQYFGACGGCQHQHLSAERMLEYKQQAIDSMLKRAGIETDGCWTAPLSDKSTGYRRKARFATDARNTEDKQFGFRRRADNSVMTIDRCPLLVDEINNLLAPLNTAFAEMENPRSLGHVSVTRGENMTQVCLRIAGTLTEVDKACWQGFGQEQKVDVVLETASNTFEVLVGNTTALQIRSSESVLLEALPSDFIQVNDSVNQRMVEQAIQWLALEPEDRVLDLFCGIGNFTLPIASKVQAVLGVEGIQDMVQRACTNAEQNGLENTRFVQADLNQLEGYRFLSDFAPNKVLLDPSREGAHGLVPALGQMKPELVLYVSCNPATFVRDAQQLHEQGYRLRQICTMDMFSYTAHTELMALYQAS